MSRDIRSVFPTGFDFAGCLARAHGGDRQALNQLLKASVPYLRAAVLVYDRRKRGPRDSDLDLVQMTLVRAWQHFGDSRASIEREFLAWLRRILHNLAADYRLEQQHRPASLEEFPELIDPTTEGSENREEERLEAIVQALTHLDEETQQIIVWRHFHKWTWEEVGQCVGRSADAVRVADFRALRKCAHLLVKLAPDLFTAHQQVQGRQPPEQQQ